LPVPEGPASNRPPALRESGEASGQRREIRSATDSPVHRVGRAHGRLELRFPARSGWLSPAAHHRVASPAPSRAASTAFPKNRRRSGSAAAAAYLVHRQNQPGLLRGALRSPRARTAIGGRSKSIRQRHSPHDRIAEPVGIVG